MGETSSDSEDTQPQQKKYPKKSPKVFQEVWLLDPLFKNWLRADKKDKTKCRCKVCGVQLVCGKSELKKHMTRQKHIKNMNAVNISKPIASYFEDKTEEKHIENVKKAEIKLAVFFAEHNVATMVVDHLVPLLKTIFIDSKICSDITLGRTKCGQIINNVIGAHETNILVEHLKSNFFSILIDESTDISEKKNMCLLVRYSDLRLKMVKTNLLELISLDATDCSAPKIYNSFKNCLNKYNIPLENIIGAASDGANVMVGEHSSFFSHLKQDVPHVILMRCICHSAALVASKACEELPRGPEDLVRNIASYISGSAKRCATLVELQEYFNQSKQKILKLATTRWLSRHDCVVRILNNWDVLEHFFLLAINEDKLKSAETIHNDMQNMYLKGYLFFMKYALNFLNSFNALFQSGTILIHKLREHCHNLFKQLCSNYLKPELCNSERIFSINLRNPEIFLQLNKIKLGGECELFLKALPVDGQEEFRKKCLSFYITAAIEISSRLPLKDPIFKSMEFLDPLVAFSPIKNSETEIANLAANFSQFIDVTNLTLEWHKLPTSFNEIEIENFQKMPIDQMWLTIGEAKNFNDESLFPNLGKLAIIVLTLPHSNAEAERIFSMVSDIKIKKRNRIGEETLNAMCVIRNALHQDKQTCIDYPIPDELLQKHTNKDIYSFKKK